MDLIDYMVTFLADSDFWLPKNTNWSQINRFTHYSFNNSVLYPIYVALCLFLIRNLFEKFIARPIGRLLDIKETHESKFIPDAHLEVYYKQNSNPNESIYMHIARDVNKNVEEVKKWFAARKLIGRPTKMKKFTESCWRFTFYLSIWVYGLYTLYWKSWMWDTKDFWRKYPNHLVTSDIYWYYTIELGFYLSLLVSQFFDIKRKDFWQMFVHHLVTISLMTLSYVCNFTRIGSFVLLLHDCVDYWLELGKLSLYSNRRALGNFAFAVFALMWFVTRIVIFPLRVLYSSTVDGPELVGGIFPGYFVFNGLLYALQVMHVMWFWIICRMAYRGLVKGSLEKDDRSESDDFDGQNEEEGKQDQEASRNFEAKNK